MARFPMYAGFALFSILISLLPGYYVLSHIVFFFGLSLGPFFWVGVILLGILFMAGMAISAISDDPKFRGVNIGLGIWVGFFLILLFLLIFLDIVNLVFVWPDRQTMGKAVMVIAAVLTIAGAGNAMFVRTRKVKVPAKGIKKRIALLSDLHLGPTHNLRYFKRVVELTNRQEPDIILITGDLIDGRLTDKMFAPINDLKAPVYFSPGNHEHYAGMDEIIMMLSHTKAVPLINKKVDLGDIELAGIDFDWNSKAFEAMISKVVPSDGKYAILMSHGPPAFDAARKAGFNLTVSGHTHGGQFWPFTMFGRLFVKYRVGMYEKEGKRLFVTSGTGTWGPPIRLGVNSELAVLDIG